MKEMIESAYNLKLVRLRFLVAGSKTGFSDQESQRREYEKEKNLLN
jgi:hypothetical protein